MNAFALFRISRSVSNTKEAAAAARRKRNEPPLGSSFYCPLTFLSISNLFRLLLFLRRNNDETKNKGF